MNEFIKLTNRDGGGDLFLRRDMVAAVGSYRGVTHVTLVNEDIDYEVKESPAEVIRLLQGADPRPRNTGRPKAGGQSLTGKSMFGTIRAKGKPDEKDSPRSGEDVRAPDGARESSKC